MRFLSGIKRRSFLSLLARWLRSLGDNPQGIPMRSIHHKIYIMKKDINLLIEKKRIMDLLGFHNPMAAKMAGL
ncbi:conserved hypothetical protein [Ricinus communis]|uniref:Uncharacterized protein n=1 Tax=Ricinus communis TaxID=3988 RepID=B9RL19_RICCO|nr:conserved hypothetical protein [Ricinus communis]